MNVKYKRQTRVRIAFGITAIFVLSAMLSQAQAGKLTTVRYQPPGFDLGEVAKRGKLTKVVKLHNTGRSDLRIKSVRSNCACAKVDSFDTQTPPGKWSGIVLEIDLSKEKKSSFNYKFYVTANTRPRKITSFNIIGSIADLSGPEKKTISKTNEAVEEEDPVTVVQEAHRLQVILFYSPGCPGCVQVEKALAKSRTRFGNKIVVYKIDIDRIENYETLMKYEEHYRSGENATLKVFVGKRYLAGPGQIVKNLDHAISDELKAERKTYLVGESNRKRQNKALASVADRFRSFKVLPVALAGLVDGINPCAFTSIVFLFSMLMHLKKSRRQILTVGLCFAIGVFITYLGLGLGALKAIRLFVVSSGTTKIITYISAAFAFVLGILSLRDYLRYRKTGRARDMKLSLPKPVKRKIHDVVRSRLKTCNLVAGGFIIGVLISLLESICTGQVYLPTIVFVLKEPGLRTHALGYLTLYNVMFILPLIVVIVLVGFGLSSQRLVQYAERNLGLMKISLAIIFIVLGTLLILT